LTAPASGATTHIYFLSYISFKKKSTPLTPAGKSSKDVFGDTLPWTAFACKSTVMILLAPTNSRI